MHFSLVHVFHVTTARGQTTGGLRRYVAYSPVSASADSRAVNNILIVYLQTSSRTRPSTRNNDSDRYPQLLRFFDATPAGRRYTAAVELIRDGCAAAAAAVTVVDCGIVGRTGTDGR